MKIMIRSTCLIMSMLCIFLCVSSCAAKLPDALKNEERGARIPFDMDTLSSHSCFPDFSGEEGLEIHFKTEGFEGADYVNCTINVTFTCTVLYDDMTEEDIERTFTVELPFSGSIDAVELVKCNKTIHNVYDEEFTINRVSGTLIKK